MDSHSSGVRDVLSRPSRTGYSRSEYMTTDSLRELSKLPQDSTEGGKLRISLRLSPRQKDVEFTCKSRSEGSIQVACGITDLYLRCPNHDGASRHV